MGSSIIKFESQKHKLVGLLNTPKNNKKHLVLLLHGLTNSMKDCPLINEATNALTKLGYPTFRFDYYGSGLSAGKFRDKTLTTLVRNTQDALEFITKQLGYKDIGVWGRSLGAIGGATISDSPGVKATVLLSTTMHTNTTFYPLFKEGRNCSLPFKGTGKIKGEPILNKKFYEQTRWMDKLQRKHLSDAQNVLIIQGTEDKTVYDTSWAKEIYEITQKPKKLVYIKGADHSYRGFENIAIVEAMEWFNKHLS